MKGLEELWFYNERNRDGKYVGRVREFPDLRTKPRACSFDSIGEIVTLTAQRIREIHESQERGLR